MWGATLHLIGRDRASDAERLGDYIQQEQIDYFKIAPSYLAALLAGAEPQKIMPRRVLMVGGEALGRGLAEQALRLGGGACKVVNHYGPTETTVGVLTYQVELDGGDAGATLPLGRPMSNMSIYVLDEHLLPAPVGVVGELYIGGAGVARGYLGRPELTAERFVPDAYGGEAGSRMYRTGDVGRWAADGNVEFLGRIDHQVKIRGYRVEVEEIETVLEEHPAVRSAVVEARADGRGELRLACYVVWKESAQVDGLRSWARERLPDYMVPVAWIELDELPRTPQGKVDRKALPAPESVTGKLSEQSSASLPRTPPEELVANVWEAVLNVRAVGRDDNFFELGGHSLLATQVISRIREVFQIDLPLRTLFEQPTVAAFAVSVGEALKLKSQLAPTPPIRPIPRSGELPLSFAQQRLWFLDQWEPSSPFYNSPSVLRLSGRLELAVLQRTLFEVVRRHEVLRTSFPSMNGNPRQRIVESWQPLLPLIDLSALDQGAGEEVARRLAQREALQPFDLATGPLLRATVLRLSAEDHVLLFTLHHIVSDGWSMGLLVREVAALYKAYQEGQESPLEELAVQYADYAVWQREWLAGEVLEGQLEYWRRQLAGAPPMLELPADRPRPRVQSYRGAAAGFRLNGELTAGLKELSRRSGVTLFMTLLAGFEVLLWRLSGQEDICVGTAIANRTRRETEGLIGFFVNTLVLRVEVNGEMSSRELLGRVREVCLGAYGHQEVPFERLVEELRPERSLNHSPLFQVAFGLDNAPREELQLPGLKLSGMESENEVVRFDLTLWMTELAGELSGRWMYRTELFDAERVQRMSRQLERLLENMVANPEARIETLEMFTEAEKEQKAIEGKVRGQANYQKLLSVKPKPIRRTG